MGLIRKVGVFGIKCSCMSYCCYHCHNIGVWGDSSKTTELYKNVVALSKPYYAQLMKRVQPQLPVQIEELPSINDLSRCTVFYWNKGVITSTNFIGNSPSLILSYLNNGVTYLITEVSKERK